MVLVQNGRDQKYLNSTDDYECRMMFQRFMLSLRHAAVRDHLPGSSTFIHGYVDTGDIFLIDVIRCHSGV